ncbi:30S ribosomal protein S17e [Salinirubrum litoreum]|jgi:small subunit ribosomal protein S17e|uniref:Small ribosomal subunit protein eS17 n=1 Tax=Salinirubrum litoreum TaxID=1126234 RepID=A0ABD5RBM3_9EURY|nr:30S ribosomal protein S17e [Salinirubrum litoreum]
MAIKPKYVKQLGTILLERYPQAFNTDFETNKESVAKLTNVESKSVRNRIAGYVTRKKAGGKPSA